MTEWLYSDVVKDHFMNPKNVLEDDESSWPCDGRGIVGNIKCGDQMLILLRIKDDVITDVRWKTYGCASAIASTSILSEAIKGMPLKEAYILKPQDIVAKLGGLPANKIHCSVLGDKALRAAIDDYLEKNGLPSLKGKEEVTVICTCLNVTDRDIEDAYKAGDRTWEDLQARTKIGTACGGCREKTMELLHELEHLYGE
ncbi:iron-sulfur cluster assembly scaffold protein [Treponema zuelzerae]|uniref:Iron-sulfur cluster assembly scaffold protein n=1 Tax=Teretinema zuelzerae TaxID=156 RepID=A0AAE3JIL8_9SPIR|nr:iron-sulfur cluster assembly scaffold protein [Teretinema zuelzerae]MBN2810995.1 iron-sulfur cluster assembly scaffold protein [Spirochaetales bacterium]MCD1653305.1 iron-sulfur cluster assembly scaffold protein [Teretinema zuelzerae]